MRKINFTRFELVRILNPPDVLTFGNLVCGLASILLSINGLYTQAILILLLSVIFDYFDGKVATMLGRKSDFGRELDSLVDLVSFGVAPAVHGYLFLEANPLVMLILLFYVTCGAVRLARYNVMNYPKGFMGMPITVNGVLFPLVFSLPFLHGMYAIFYIISGFAMVSHFKIKRVI